MLTPGASTSMPYLPSAVGPRELKGVRVLNPVSYPVPLDPTAIAFLEIAGLIIEFGFGPPLPAGKNAMKLGLL